ncbi:hypothetical protein ZWY2020_020862, partial [Hordeum vulgare]
VRSIGVLDPCLWYCALFLDGMKEIFEGSVGPMIHWRDQKKRPTEFGMNQVLQPFHSEKFNFTKVKPEEVIFRFQETENDSAYPIGYCHVLLLPQVQECLPQRARNPFFRVGYNSLGAFATTNHLHFQAYYLKVQYPVKKAPTEELTVVGNGVSISQLVQYPVSGFNNRPFNVLISESSKRVFLLLQYNIANATSCYAEKQTSGKASHEFLDITINPAVWELSGHLVLKRRKDYDEASEATLRRLLVEASLSGAEFQELKRCVLESLASASPE